MIQTIIFDFDGTIADSFATMVEIFESMTGQEKKLTPAIIESLQGASINTILHELNITKWQVPRLLIKGRRAVTERILDIPSFKDLPEALKKLHDLGYQMHILSSNSQVNINKFLVAHKLDSYFSAVYGNVGLLGKATALRKVIKKERLDSRQCLYIGDEVRDIEAAQKVGIACIAVSWGFNTPAVLQQTKPTMLVSLPSDLPESVEHISKSTSKT